MGIYKVDEIIPPTTTTASDCEIRPPPPPLTPKAIGGFILGWAFRKGWDRAAPKAPPDQSA